MRTIISLFSEFGEISFHRIGAHNLFIFPELPSWIVLNDLHATIFKYLVDGISLEIIEENVRLIFPECMDLPFEINVLIDKLESRKIFPYPSIAYNASDPEIYPTHIHICITHSCNLHCKHCFLSAGIKIDNELTTKQWIAGLSNIFKFVKNPYVTISGGEPTTVADLKELLIFLKDSGATVSLYTNGHNSLNDIEKYVDAIQISLEGLQEKTHDYIRGSGSFFKIMNNIKNIPREKLNLAFLILPHNFHEIKAKFFDFIHLNGILIDNVRMNAELENEGRAKNLEDNFHNFFSENADDILKFVSSVFQYNPRLLLRNMRNCGIGISIGIDSNGNIYPCDIFFEKYANIFDEDLNVKLMTIKEFNKRTEIGNIEICKECDLRYICLGGCKVKNKIKNGMYTQPTCTDNSKKIKYYRLIYDVGV